ncbi:MAG: aromatic ring-opening dioxygenase subunit LigA [Burkholderiales bacterium]
MSLYGMQKFLYQLNRDARVQQRFRDEPAVLLADYPLDAEELAAITRGDIGLIYVLGANGQLLMHFAAFLGMPWPDYLQSMRDGVAKHGPVRAGVYAMTTQMDEKVAGL